MLAITVVVELPKPPHSVDFVTAKHRMHKLVTAGGEILNESGLGTIIVRYVKFQSEVISNKNETSQFPVIANLPRQQNDKAR